MYSPSDSEEEKKMNDIEQKNYQQKLFEQIIHNSQAADISQQSNELVDWRIYSYEQMNKDKDPIPSDLSPFSYQKLKPFVPKKFTIKHSNKPIQLPLTNVPLFYPKKKEIKPPIISKKSESPIKKPDVQIGFVDYQYNPGKCQEINRYQRFKDRKVIDERNYYPELYSPPQKSAIIADAPRFTDEYEFRDW